MNERAAASDLDRDHLDRIGVVPDARFSALEGTQPAHVSALNDSYFALADARALGSPCAFGARPGMTAVIQIEQITLYSACSGHCSTSIVTWLSPPKGFSRSL